MTTIALVLIGLVQDPSAQERAQRILERIDAAFARFREETLRGMRERIDRELTPYRRPAAEDAGMAFLHQFAAQIVDDGGDNTTIRSALTNPDAQREILQQLSALNLRPEEIAEQIFERREDGCYQVRPEYAAMLVAIARAYPGTPPGPTPPGPGPTPPGPGPTPPGPAPGQPYVGVRPDGGFTDEHRAQLGLSPAQGVRILTVAAGSPAAQADLREGDVVIQAGGQDVTEPNFRDILGCFSVGQEILMTVLRGPERLEIRVVVGRR